MLNGQTWKIIRGAALLILFLVSILPYTSTVTAQSTQTIVTPIACVAVYPGETHPWYLDVRPGVKEFTLAIYDGDGAIIRVYKPGGVLVSEAVSDWDTTNEYTIPVGQHDYGTWRIEFTNTYANDNVYTIGVYGAGMLRLFMRTPSVNTLLLARDDVKGWYLFVPPTTREFTFKVRDGDGLRVRVYDPRGTLVTETIASSNGDWDTVMVKVEPGRWGTWYVELDNAPANPIGSTPWGYMGPEGLGYRRNLLRLDTSLGVIYANQLGTEASRSQGNFYENR